MPAEKALCLTRTRSGCLSAVLNLNIDMIIVCFKTRICHGVLSGENRCFKQANRKEACYLGVILID